MEKSRGSTDRKDRFYGERSARLQEWGWACLFLGTLLAFRLWQRHESMANWPNRPKADVADLLTWAETFPGYAARVRPFRANFQRKRRHDQSGASHVESLVQLELNLVDAEGLQQLRGVGPVLSERIVRFRDALGGFLCIEDLYEVYGLDSIVVDQARPHLTANAQHIQSLCLDTVSFGTLLKHPRFDLETTKKLIRARGRGVHAMDVVLLRSRLDSVTLRKVRPYLTICSGL